MEVTRTQFSVGQGCFHAGHVRWTSGSSPTPDDYHYIYDCGSSEGYTALKRSISNWHRRTYRLDALFVSHLHADHVNGIDRLLSSVNADTVYIPHVDTATHVLEILAADFENAASTSLIEARLDPRSWFGRRGVARIVRVLPERSEPFALETSLRSDTPKDRTPRSRTHDSSAHRPTLATMQSGQALIPNHGLRHPWALVSHVDPAPDSARTTFLRRVRRTLGLAPRQQLKPARLAAALRDRRQRARLRRCYEEIIPGGSSKQHNRVSMSLYSGPADTGSQPRTCDYATVTHSSPWPYNPSRIGSLGDLPFDRTAAGWLGTGDASLNVYKVRAAWRRSYDPFRNQIAHSCFRTMVPSAVSTPA